MSPEYLEIFEDLSRENDITFWLASDLMELLGYSGKQSFRKAINRAQAACANLNIPPEKNFIFFTDDGGSDDIKLSRFACYLVAMNADARKPEVAQVQAYLATLAESVRRYIEQAEDVVRVPIRAEITEREKSLSGVAKEAGVTIYAYFQASGYRGMYNMNIAQLRRLKGVPDKRSPLDFMGKTELAANLFRITQTEERIRTNDIRGQSDCEEAAWWVGKEVRDTMRKLSNTVPEDLPPVDDIRTVKKQLKQQHKRLSKIDPKATGHKKDTNS
ncbi:MAG: BRO family protein [bacterium]